MLAHAVTTAASVAKWLTNSPTDLVTHDPWIVWLDPRQVVDLIKKNCDSGSV